MQGSEEQDDSIRMHRSELCTDDDLNISDRELKTLVDMGANLGLKILRSRMLLQVYSYFLSSQSSPNFDRIFASEKRCGPIFKSARIQIEGCRNDVYNAITS